MSKKEIVLQKIPLEGFIDILMQLYNNGANYIDIVGEPNVEQDVISVLVKKEYIDDTINLFPMEENISLKLTDDEINELLN